MLRIVTFGEATIWLGRERVAPSASRMFALGLYLGAERGRDVPRSVLQALLFPESDERSASHSLRQLVYRMRQLGAQLESSPDSVAVGTERVSDDYSALVSAPELEPEQIELATKGFMPGYAPGFSEAFADWVDAFRGRTTLEIRRKALAAMEDARARCNWAAVAHAARGCLALDPLNEDATIGLAESLAMTGSKAEALARLDRYEEELPPGAQECRAAARRLRHRISSRVAEPSPVSLRDMPLVGREEEMRRLTTALAHTRANGGGVVLITGEPGIGKTRLIAEFERVASLSGARTARVVCRAATSHQPLSPFIELTRQLLQMPGALGCSPEALQALRGLCNSPERSATLPAVGQFNARAAFAATVSAIVDLLDSVATENALILLIDDTQWLDSASLELLQTVDWRGNGSRVLLVLGGRERLLSAGETSEAANITRIVLGPIEPAAGATLFRLVVGTAVPRPTPTAEDRVLAFGSGNPLFLQVLGMQYRAQGDTLDAPPPIAELLRGRVSALSGDARSVLECCAIMGRRSSVARIESALGIEPLRLLSALRELEGLGLLAETENVLSAGHPMVSEIVAQSLSAAVEKLLHVRAARLLAAECSQASDASLLWDCADHWEKAAEADQAVAVIRSCILHSLSIGCAQDAWALLDRALNLRGCSSAARAETLRFAAATYEVLGDWQRATELAAERLRVSLGPVADADAQVVALHSRHATSTRDEPGRARTLAVLNDQTHPHDVRVRAAASLIAYAEDEFEPTLAEATRAVLESIAPPPTHDWNAERYWLIYHTCFGDIQTARSIACDLAGQYMYGTTTVESINRRYNVVYALARSGELNLARELLDCTRSAVAALGAGPQAVWCACWVTWLACQDQRWEEARARSVEAEKLATSAAFPLPVMHRLNKVDITLACDHPQQARQTLDELLAHEPGPHSARKALHIAQLENRTNRALGLPTTASQVLTLEAGHLRGRSLGMHDDVVVALVGSLREHGRFTDASELLAEYLVRYRRDPFPIPNGLALLCPARSTF